MKSLKWDYETASKYVVQKREVAVPNSGYERQLRFLGSSFYKHCTEMTLLDQYAYWRTNSGIITCCGANQNKTMERSILQEFKKLSFNNSWRRKESCTKQHESTLRK
jgi:hypothetical protein